jgi:hypothetical protein
LGLVCPAANQLQVYDDFSAGLSGLQRLTAPSNEDWALRIIRKTTPSARTGDGRGDKSN